MRKKARDRDRELSSPSEDSALPNGDRAQPSLSSPFHNSPRFNRAWQLFQGGLFVFPLFPALGAIAMGLASSSALQQNFRKIRQLPLNGALALLAILLVASSCFAVNGGDAFLGLANLIPFFIVFAGLSQLLQTPIQLRRMAWIIVLSSIPVVILGLGQMLGEWTTPQLVWNIFGWDLEQGGNPPGRMASSFMYANLLAFYLLIVLILGLGIAIEAFQEWRKDPTLKQQWFLLGLTAILLGNGLGLLLTSSRNAWGVTAIACLAFVVYLGWYWLVAGVSATAGVVLWASFGPPGGRGIARQIVPSLLWRRLSGEMYEPAEIEALRTSQWKFALSMTRDRPFFGWGLRSFPQLYEAKTQLWFGHPHNLFLMLSGEAGIPATLLLCAIAAWVLARAILLLRLWTKALRPQWRSDRLILLTYIIAFAGCILFNFLDVTVFDLRTNTYGWILLSALCGVVYRYGVLLP
ncbi:MAG: polymerase [Cyanobacteriota bacterium]|nr:polymerase [Cyanobacteriota bacterium]